MENVKYQFYKAAVKIIAESKNKELVKMGDSLLFPLCKLVYHYIEDREAGYLVPLILFGVDIEKVKDGFIINEIK